MAGTPDIYGIFNAICDTVQEDPRRTEAEVAEEIARLLRIASGEYLPQVTPPTQRRPSSPEAPSTPDVRRTQVTVLERTSPGSTPTS